MNVTNLPTNIFTVSNTISAANRLTQTDDTPLGDGDYTLLMWSPAMTAFVGDGATGHFGTDTKLSGLVIK